MDEFNCNHVLDENQLRIPTSNNYVYKDECTKCYLNNENENGLFLCLACYNGGCEEMGHGVEHFKRSNHFIAMRIKKIKHYEKKDTAMEKSKTSFSTHIFCFECGLLDKKKLPLWDTLNSKILSATNASDLLLSKTPSYGDIIKCSHALNLEQTNERFSLKKIEQSKCAQCDKTSGLWFCLSCGALNCGRRFFDGSGGNGHAIKHFAKTKHPIAVKLGTTSESGDADVFCYICDDAVENPFVLKHLRFFGIEDFVKTEKNTLELELDANRRFNWSSTVDFSKIVPLYGPNLTGIKNIENNCYISSILHILASLNPFRERYLVNGKSHSTECLELVPANCIKCQLHKFLEGISSGVHSKPLENKKGKQPGVNVSMLKSVLCRSNGEFLSHRQQDALEFLTYTLTMLKKTERQSEKIPRTTDLFKIRLENSTKCMSCNKVCRNTEKTAFLSVPLKPPNAPNIAKPLDFDAAFDILFEAEILDKLRCDHCETVSEHIKKTTVTEFPQILAIQLKRFAFKDGRILKDNSPMDIPETLDLQRFKTPLNSNHNNLNSTTKKAKMAASPELLQSLESMGFDRESCAKALVKSKNDMEKALDRLLNGERFTIEETQVDTRHREASKKLGGKYSLFAFVVHKGTTTTHGHYNAHLKRGSKWVCFDDTRVYLSDLKSASEAYLLLFKSSESEDV